MNSCQSRKCRSRGWVDHVDYVVARIGIDHVGFGSDFDGATMPAELGDAAGLQRVAGALRERGYAEDASRSSPTATGSASSVKPGPLRTKRLLAATHRGF